MASQHLFTYIGCERRMQRPKSSLWYSLSFGSRDKIPAQGALFGNERASSDDPGRDPGEMAWHAAYYVGTVKNYVERQFAAKTDGRYPDLARG